MHIDCGFKGLERKDEVDPRPKGSGRSGERSHSPGMWPNPALLGGEGALGPGPVPHPGRAAAGRQLPVVFSAAAAAETNDGTDEEQAKIKMSTEGGGLGTGAGIFS